MTTEIQLTDWEALTTELKQFGATGDITTDDDRICIDFGNAYIEVMKQGIISTGMPLHNLEHDGDMTIIIDHENGSLAVETDNLDYMFCRP
jgi:hypothetical protein